MSALYPPVRIVHQVDTVREARDSPASNGHVLRPTPSAGASAGQVFDGYFVETPQVRHQFPDGSSMPFSTRLRYAAEMPILRATWRRPNPALRRALHERTESAFWVLLPSNLPR